jgi:hypothetical protein
LVLSDGVAGFFAIDLLAAVALRASTPVFRVDTWKEMFHRGWVRDDWRWVEMEGIFDFRFSIFDLGNGLREVIPSRVIHDR